jgi:polysaccharide chain length determinant protein (PEP-CTERM system associated)
MNDQETNKSHSWESTLEVFLRRKWLLLIPLVLGVAGSYGALQWIPATYKSTTVILVEPQKISQDYVKSTVPIDIQERLSSITQQVMSRTRLETIMKQFGLFSDKKDLAPEELIVAMREKIEVNVETTTTKGKNDTLNVFSISFLDQEPQTAMLVTSKLASLFIEENLKIREQQAEGTTLFLEQQLQEVKSTLEEQESRIRVFRQQYMGELPSQLEANLRTLDRLQLSLQSANEALRMSEDRRASLEREMLIYTPTPNLQAANPEEARLKSLREDLSRAEALYTDEYPEVIRLRREVRELEARLAEEAPVAAPSQEYLTNQQNVLLINMANQLRSLTAEIHNLEEKRKEISLQIQNLAARVERTPIREQQLSALIRDYDNTKSNYESLLGKKLDAQLSENLEKRQKGEQFRILDPANLPEKPFSPEPQKVYLIGTGLGLASGIGLVMLFEFLDSSFRRPEDFYPTTGLPVLAAIPLVKTKKIRR